jgi:hypothetical protein
LGVADDETAGTPEDYGSTVEGDPTTDAKPDKLPRFDPTEKRCRSIHCHNENKIKQLLGQVFVFSSIPAAKFRHIADPKWLAKVTNTLNQHWQRKNAAKKNWLTREPPKEHSASSSIATTKL